jgi:hypothetical protein
VASRPRCRRPWRAGNATIRSIAHTISRRPTRLPWKLSCRPSRVIGTTSYGVNQYFRGPFMKHTMDQSRCRPDQVATGRHTLHL